jgi:hypothetical protein
MDPLCRIFGNPNQPISGLQGPKLPREEPLPHYEFDVKTGISTPHNFDNDRMIKVFEESLKSLVDNVGMAHPGVAGTADGLAKLYEMKAGVEKDIACYDKAIEYLQYANTSREKQMGRSANKEDSYKENEALIKRIQRKKERRIAKTVQAEETSLAIPSARVIEVRLVAAGQLVFFREDGTTVAFNKPGSKPNERGFDALSEFVGIDNDVTERFSTPPFQLQDGEFIVGMLTHEKQQQGELNAICFHTSQGRRSQWFEFNDVEPRGREYAYWAVKDSHIIGLEAKGGHIAVPCGIIEGHRGRTTS